MGVPLDIDTARINRIKGPAAGVLPRSRPNQRRVVAEGEATHDDPGKILDKLPPEDGVIKMWWIAAGVAVGVILVLVVLKYKLIKL